jgi:hypothetical protein
VADIYRSGFTGGSVEESTEWMAAQAQGAKTICVPFAGIGRALVNMAGPETAIESWDTMHYARCIIQGVFAAKEAETNVDKIRYRKGYAFEHRPFKNMDDRSAGFIDWVATNGTLYDKACLGSAMVRCTLMARMMHWHANVEQLYTRFQKQFEYNKDWLNRPGEFVHHEGNFFDRHLAANDQGEVQLDQYDLLHVDPPKVINYSDVYSLHFKNFNAALTQGEVPTLPKWSRRNSLGHYRKVMEVKAPRVIFMYVSGVFPLYEDVKRVLGEYGTIEDEVQYSHQGRTDYGLLITR